MSDKVYVDPLQSLDEEDARCLCTAQDLLPKFQQEDFKGSEMFGDSTWVLNNREMARLMEIAVIALEKAASKDQIRRGNFYRGVSLSEIGEDLKYDHRGPINPR